MKAKHRNKATHTKIFLQLENTGHTLVDARLRDGSLLNKLNQVIEKGGVGGDHAQVDRGLANGDSHCLLWGGCSFVEHVELLYLCPVSDQHTGETISSRRRVWR